MAQMEPSLTLYNDAKNYPRNIANRNLAPYVLDAIRHQLDVQAPRLFTDESQATVDFLDLESSAQDFWPSRIKTAERLREHLGSLPPSDRRDYRCRFLFIHAAHSRDKLKISQQMLMLCFAQFQVMPEFVDFLFPFGFQSYAHDFYFSGFRQRTKLAERRQNLTPDATAIEKSIQTCYSLKSVEPSDTDDWSIRHCAVQHSIEMKEVRTTWVIVKGDELMKRRIESATSDSGTYEASDFKAIDRAFEASLGTHLIFCDWSAENWRWYINFLEDKFQSMTRRAFSAPVHVPLPPAADMDQLTLQPRTNTQRTARSTFSMFSRTQTQVTTKDDVKPALKHRMPTPQTYTNPDTGISQPLPPEEDDDDDDDYKPESSLNADEINVGDEHQEFSFSKLRKVHHIAEKANEAVLVLKQNIIVLAQLRQYYMSITKRRDFPTELRDNCKDAIDDFELRIEGLENDMQTQILRLETLLRLLEDRKNLVKQIIESKRLAKLRKHQLHSILDYQNTQANKYSTKSMFTMTEDMNDIARKTKIETVSMKVITLVTLFFLPGTFISTLMSTEIFQRDYTGPKMPNPYARLSPLQIYLALSLPLTIVTLLFWAGFHLWEIHQEKQRKREHKAAGWQV